jgi:hypothetical protein
MGLFQPNPHPNEAQAYRDAFGRLRTSEPKTLFDSKLIVADMPTLFWDDQQISGSGTSSTYLQSDARIRLAVSNATAGTRVRQTFRRFNYQPGKSHTAFMTFNFNGGVASVIKRAGLYDSNNGVFLQLDGTTLSFVVRKAGVDRVYPQSGWNLDRLDGGGYSGFTLDLTKAQLFYFDFEWLGVGSIRLGFVLDGRILIAHQIDHANIETSVYTSTPNLPMRYEISNTGAGAATSMDCICCTVTSEGGLDDTGVERGVDTGITGLVTNNDTSLYPVLGLRLKSTHQSATVRPISFNILCTSTATYRYVVCFNPTLAGTAPTWVPVTNSALESATPTNATTVSSPNFIVLSGYDQQGGGYSPSSSGEIRGFLSLGASIAGVSDQIWICATRISGTTETFLASARWRESL